MSKQTFYQARGIKCREQDLDSGDGITFQNMDPNDFAILKASLEFEKTLKEAEFNKVEENISRERRKRECEFAEELWKSKENQEMMKKKEDDLLNGWLSVIKYVIDTLISKAMEMSGLTDKQQLIDPRITVEWARRNGVTEDVAREIFPDIHWAIEEVYTLEKSFCF